LHGRSQRRRRDFDRHRRVDAAGEPLGRDRFINVTECARPIDQRQPAALRAREDAAHGCPVRRVTGTVPEAAQRRATFERVERLARMLDEERFAGPSARVQLSEEASETAFGARDPACGGRRAYERAMPDARIDS